MIDTDTQIIDQSMTEAVVQPPTAPRVATWRFLGERSAADDAYCARFGVSHAPEPFIGRDKVWAYTLPAVESR